MDSLTTALFVISVTIFVLVGLLVFISKTKGAQRKKVDKFIVAIVSVSLLFIAFACLYSGSLFAWLVFGTGGIMFWRLRHVIDNRDTATYSL